MAAPDTSNGGCLNVETPEPGTVEDSTCFTKVSGFNAYNFLFVNISEDKNITTNDLAN
ncbi:uncharacterized protein LY79DRAFT_550978 [Colletotrichum navitas]|uniref:Uncharacterized protein n=1 Tax=Colletotrichum navitas TaxID=681940 RepID=A0AAD8V4C2_9PEZI|nr:uncharacterized protein LY79DRAFT_550978 [Colletotrichum navitas]KAK1593807.1 hypothetical protein LY79DRAFT_550978 [Colletotrichum navitas]